MLDFTYIIFNKQCALWQPTPHVVMVRKYRKEWWCRAGDSTKTKYIANIYNNIMLYRVFNYINFVHRNYNQTKSAGGNTAIENSYSQAFIKQTCSCFCCKITIWKYCKAIKLYPNVCCNFRWRHKAGYCYNDFFIIMIFVTIFL